MHLATSARLRGERFLRPASWIAAVLAALSLFNALAASPSLLGVPLQAKTDVSPDAAPQIQKIEPDHGAPREQVNVVVTGANFSSGAYVSASSPFVHVVSTERVSATELRAQLAIGAKAVAGAVTLYVSNSASVVAQTQFTISTPAPSPPPVETPSAGTPEVSQVSPAQVAQGSQATVKVKGKNFAPGTKVSFANPGIVVLSTEAPKPGELSVSIQVAPDAPAGSTSLFVVNPDDSEAEAAFEVTPGSPTDKPTPGTPTTRTTTKTPTTGGKTAAEQRFEVYNLGDAVSILQNPGNSKGTLIVGGGKLRYEDAGQVVFAASAKEVREVDVNTIYGLSTRTFHIILTAGKRYNFAGASLKQDESQTLVNAIRAALQLP